MGLVLPAIGYFLLPDHPYINAMASFGLIVAISYGFELYSKFTGHGHYDVMDAVASVVGGLAGMAMLGAGVMGMG